MASSRRRRAAALLAVVLVAACGEEPVDRPFAHYAEAPSPMRLVEVLDGKPDEARRRVLEQALELHGIPYRVHAYTGPGGPGRSLEVELGSDGPVLILSAHYDRVPESGGANDDASCVAALVQAYQALAAQSPPPRITVRVIFFDDEELGLVGSRAYVESRDLSAVRGVIGLELCGIGDAVGIWDVAEGLADAAVVKAIARAAEAEGIYSATHGPVPRFSGDHWPFQKHGIPAVGLTVLPREDEATLRAYVADPDSLRWLFRFMRPTIFQTYHAPGDTAATIDEAALAMTARLVVRTVGEFTRLLVSAKAE